MKKQYTPIVIGKFNAGLVSNIDPNDIPGKGFRVFQNFVIGRYGGGIAKRLGIREAGCGVPTTSFEIIQLYFASLQKQNVKTGYMFVQLKGDTNGLDLHYCEYNYSTKVWGSWSELVGTANPAGGAVKADKLNFAGVWRDGIRIGCGANSDSYPLWVGYINKEKDTDLNGYFNNLVEYQGLYVSRAALAECSIETVIGYNITEKRNATAVGISAGLLTTDKRYFYKATYEYDGYQEGNADRDSFTQWTLSPPSNLTEVLHGGLLFKVSIDASTMNKRLSAINIYKAEINKQFVEGVEGGGDFQTPEDSLVYNKLIRLDINKDDILYTYTGRVEGAIDKTKMLVLNPIDLSTPNWFEIPDDLFDTYCYIKYRELGTATWTTVQITNTVTVLHSDGYYYLNISRTGDYQGSTQTKYYEVQIVSRWALSAGTTYEKYFVDNGMIPIGNQYVRKFGDVNYKRSTFVQDRQVACGNYVLQDAPEDIAKFFPDLVVYSEFNTDGTPEPDKLSGFFYLSIDSDDEAIIAKDFKWSKDYADRLVVIFCKKSIHLARFDANGVMMLDREPYPIGLVAPDTIWNDGEKFWFLGREKHKLDLFVFSPSSGKPQGIGFPVADLIKQLNKTDLFYSIGWYDAECRQYRIAFPEFES